MDFSGRYDATGLKIAVVVSRFNELITEGLLKGALGALRNCGADQEQVTVLHVPGSFEIPLAAEKLAASGSHHGIVCLGALIRGETDHYEYLASFVSRAVGEVSVRHGIPVGFGVITVNTVDEAVNRAGLKHGNKGAEAALSVVEMATLLRDLTPPD